MESRSRAEAAGRAAAGKGTAGGSSGRPGGVGNVGQTNRAPTNHPMSRAEQDSIISGPAPAPEPGGASINRARPGDYNGPQPGTADRWGFYRDPAVESPGVAKQHSQYNNAADDLDNRGFGGWLRDRLLDTIPGFHQVTPDARIPGTYNNGIYHDAWSPFAAATGVLGMASPVPGTSMITGKLGQAISDGTQMKEYTFGGGGWGATTSPSAPSTPNGLNSPHAPTGPQSPGRPTEGGSGQIPGPVQAPMPSIFSQPQQAAAQMPQQTPSIFTQPPKPNAQQYMVPGGLPYGVNLFGRGA